MSCGCNTSGDSGHSCGTKQNGCSKVDTCGNSYKLNVFDWLASVNNPALKTECEFVEVRFKNERKCFYRNVHHLPLRMGSIVTVESSPGHDVGVVSLTGELVKIQMKKKRFPEDQALKIYRISNQKDVEVWQDAREKEQMVKREAKNIASRLHLDMKITDVEYQGDGAKATFYYTAENRIDFRQLIKDFAMAFRTKIDMKQIGFRQEAAKIGGLGSCGRELCCSSWLTDFRSVNTNAARYQQLSINPQKLAGQCGKLKCCLNYELDSYLDALTDFPPSNTSLDTEKGRAFCIKIDVFKKKMWFAYADSPLGWYDLEVGKVKKFIADNKRGVKAPPLEEVMTAVPVEKTVDLIQENQMDRFEKKKPFKKDRRDGSNRPKGPKPPRDNRPEAKNPSDKPQKDFAKNQNPQNKPKKNFRKKPQKPSSDE